MIEKETFSYLDLFILGGQQELEKLNQALQNRDEMKDDAIAQLSDQVMALTTRMQEFERKQQPYVS
jgi:hypothetical protein